MAPASSTAGYVLEGHVNVNVNKCVSVDCPVGPTMTVTR